MVENMLRYDVPGGIDPFQHAGISYLSLGANRKTQRHLGHENILLRMEKFGHIIILT